MREIRELEDQVGFKNMELCCLFSNLLKKQFLWSAVLDPQPTETWFETLLLC